MRVLYVSHYFPPEIGAPAVRVSQLSKHWRRAGVDVRVLTGFPCHPEGVVPPEYRAPLRRLVMTEDYEGVPVDRTWIYPAANRGRWRRSANYLSFGISAAIRGSLLDFRPDIVIGTSPQPLCAAAAARIADRYDAKFIFEVRDLWPESLAAVGVDSKNSPFYQLLDGVAGWLYDRADRVVIVADSFREELVARGVDDEKIQLVPNGVDLAPFAGDHSVPQDVSQLSDKFVVSYIGTHGLAHALDTLLEAANLLREEPAAHFIFVGGGAAREPLEREAARQGLHNVTFLGPRPWEMSPAYLAASDACVVHLARKPLFERVLPSKIFEIMAAGKPILLGVRGEAKRLVDKAQAGLSFEPESAQGLASAVLELHHDRDLGNRLGASGRKWVGANATYKSRADKYLEILEGCC